MFNVSSLLSVLNGAANIVSEVDGFAGPEGKIIGDAAVAVVRNATAIYQQVKPTLSTTDQATVDAALQVAHDKCGTDLDRVLAELDAAAKET